MRDYSIYKQDANGYITKEELEELFGSFGEEDKAWKNIL